MLGLADQIYKEAIGAGHAGGKLAEEGERGVDVDALPIARVDQRSVGFGFVPVLQAEDGLVGRGKSAPEIDLETIENPLIRELLDKFKKAGIDVKIVNLTSDVEAATIAAVSDDTVLKDPALLTLGVGTHLNPEIAVMRALTEVAQSRATQIHGTREDTTRAVFMRKAGYERMKRINKHWFGESEEIINLNEIKNRAGNSFKEDIEISLKLLKKANLEDVLFVDLTKPEIEIPVVRVIIPEMEVYSVDPDRMGKRLT